MKKTLKEKRKLMQNKKVMALTMTTMLMTQSVMGVSQVFAEELNSGQTEETTSNSSLERAHTADETGLWDEAEYSYVYNEETGLGNFYIYDEGTISSRMPAVGAFSFVPPTVRYNSIIIKKASLNSLYGLFSQQTHGAVTAYFSLKANTIDLGDANLSETTSLEYPFVTPEVPESHYSKSASIKKIILPIHIGWVNEPLIADNFFYGLNKADLEEVTLSDDFIFGAESQFEKLGGYWISEAGEIVSARALPKLYDNNQISKGKYVRTDENDAVINFIGGNDVLQGNEFDSLKDVLATDEEGIDVTDTLEVSGNVDTSKAGEYQLTYSAVSSVTGQSFTSERTIAVLPYGETTFTGIEKTEIELGEEFDALAGVTAVDGQGNDVTTDIKVEGTVDTETAGDYELTYSVTDKVGETYSVKRQVEVVAPEIVIPSLSVDEFTIGINTAITGTYVGDNVEKMSLEINGETTSPILIKNETFSYYAKGLIKSSEDEVFVVLLDKEGNELTREPVVLKDQVNGFTSLEDYTVGTSRQVAGTYDGLATKAKLEIDGVPTIWNGIKDGIFQSYHPDKIKSGREEVYAIIMDYNNVELDRQLVNVLTDQLGDILEVSDYSVKQSTKITGTYSGNITKLSLEVNGEEKAVLRANNEAFSFYAKGLIKSTDDQVEVVAYNKFGGAVSRMVVEITE